MKKSSVVPSHVKWAERTRSLWAVCVLCMRKYSVTESHSTEQRWGKFTMNFPFDIFHINVFVIVVVRRIASTKSTNSSNAVYVSFLRIIFSTKNFAPLTRETLKWYGLEYFVCCINTMPLDRSVKTYCMRFPIEWSALLALLAALWMVVRDGRPHTMPYLIVCYCVCRTIAQLLLWWCFFLSRIQLFRCWLFQDWTGSCDSNLLWTWHALLSLKPLLALLHFEFE